MQSNFFEFMNGSDGKYVGVIALFMPITTCDGNYKRENFDFDEFRYRSSNTIFIANK